MTIPFARPPGLLLRLGFVVAVFAVLATALVTRPLKRLTDFDQSFYLTIAYDLRHHGTFSNGVLDDVDSTRAVPKPGMFFAPLYPLVIAGVAALDARFAATLDCTIEANEKHRELASCDTYARPMFVVHAAVLTVGVVAIALAAEIIFAGATVFLLAGVLASLGVLWEADLFSHLMTESLAFCVSSLFGVALVWAMKTRRRRAWVWAGLAAGVAALTRPPNLLLVPIGVLCLGVAAIFPAAFARDEQGEGAHDDCSPPSCAEGSEVGLSRRAATQEESPTLSLPTRGRGPWGDARRHASSSEQGHYEMCEYESASGGGRRWHFAWSWAGLLAALPSAAVFVVAAALVLAPWLGRNWVSVGKLGFTEEYGAATLVERLAFNDMSAREFVLAFPYCVPVIGPPVVHALFGEDAERRFEWYSPNGFFDLGRSHRNALVATYGRLDGVIGDLMRREMARDWWRHILTTLPLFWCGLWVSGLFAVALLPVFAAAVWIAARRGETLFLVYATPGLVLAFVYAMLANHYPRYNLGLIGPIAVGAAWLAVRWVRKRGATAP
jgi:hypothetical protein